MGNYEKTWVKLEEFFHTEEIAIELKGDRVYHKEFGEGEVTHVLNSGTKPTLGIKFTSIKRTKILSQNSEMEKIE